MRTVYIGMGSNLPSPAGPPAATIAAGIGQLASLGRIVCRSALYVTDPVGYADQPSFINAVVGLETGLAPRELLSRLLDVERAFGRDRSSGIQNGPRTLDLDILLMGDLTISEPGLEIPHPHLAERAFVLVPLNEIAPQVVVPRHEMTVAQLLHKLLESSEGQMHAVVPMQTHNARAGSGGGLSGAGAA